MFMFFLGLDTSNYTTSAAIIDMQNMTAVQRKMLLPVKQGELGLRQSDAVFHHIKQMPQIISGLFEEYSVTLSAIGVSYRPRNIEGSYMPCFLCGEGLADSLGTVMKLPVHKTSHQTGHILAALFSAGKLELIRRKFIAFHVSGGTTDCLLVSKDDENIINIKEIGSSLDIKAGQAIDRVGLMLGLEFPCGKELEKLAEKSVRKYSPKIVLKGGNCCLSGLENKCRKMIDDGEASENVARFCLEFVRCTIDAMTHYARDNYGDLPIIYAGGVMSDKLIKNGLSDDYEVYFAEPDFSCDNAVGTAVYAAIKENSI